jgi:hypothetical protein
MQVKRYLFFIPQRITPNKALIICYHKTIVTSIRIIFVTVGGSICPQGSTFSFWMTGRFFAQFPDGSLANESFALAENLNNVADF